MADGKVERGGKEDLNQAYSEAMNGPHFLVDLADCRNLKGVDPIAEARNDPRVKEAMALGEKVRNESCGSGWRSLYQRFSANCANAKKNLRDLESWIQTAGERGFRKCIVERYRKTESK